LGLIAGIRGNAAEASAYARARMLIVAEGVGSDADVGPLLERPDVQADAEVHERLRFMYEAGGWVLLESAIADLPSDLRWLFESEAVTIPQLAVLYDRLDTVTLADLAEVVRLHAVRDLPELGPEVESRIEQALPTLRQRSPRIPLGRAIDIAEPLLEGLRANPSVEWATPVGSLRRGRELVGDIEVMALARDSTSHLAGLDTIPDAVPQLRRQSLRLCLLIDRMTVGIRFPPSASAGALLLYLTGSTAHLAKLRAHAASRGWQLTAQGLRHTDGRLVAETEEAIYKALDLPFIPPEIRHGGDEIERGAAGSLPRLVARDDIVGDLHMHTHYSDGRDSVEEMVAACDQLGYRYMAITDHSPHSAASRNLTAQSLPQQAEEIAAAREKHPDIGILHGVEVDILADGKLDFPDKILESFDIVLASLHERHGHSPDRLLARYLRAIRHPLVNIITHPSNRLIPHRAGYDLDYDRIFAAASETGTVLEVDGAPAHLDMSGALARRAVRAGASVSIDSDSHRANVLQRQMGMGISTARRGWVEPRHVVNTRPLDEVRALFAAKRAR
jgi:DNA polymerase (family X)